MEIGLMGVFGGHHWIAIMEMDFSSIRERLNFWEESFTTQAVKVAVKRLAYMFRTTFSHTTREGCSLVDSVELEPETLMNSGVAHHGGFNIIVVDSTLSKTIPSYEFLDANPTRIVPCRGVCDLDSFMFATSLTMLGSAPWWFEATPQRGQGAAPSKQKQKAKIQSKLFDRLSEGLIFWEESFTAQAVKVALEQLVYMSGSSSWTRHHRCGFNVEQDNSEVKMVVEKAHWGRFNLGVDSLALFIHFAITVSIHRRIEDSTVHSKKREIVAVTLALLIGLFLLGIRLIVYLRKWKRNNSQLNREGIMMHKSEQGYTDKTQKEDLELLMFDLTVIADSTNNFSINNKLGEGGFGAIYKGILEGGQEIAVTWLSKNSSQGLDEFKNEVIFFHLVLCCNGYISPEYAIDGLFSVKSDVFSFGVLVLEIVSGKKNKGLYHSGHCLNLLGHAWNLYKEEKPLELIDEALWESCYQTEMLQSIHVGLLCVQECLADRPSMSSVVMMLDSKVALPWAKQPGFFTARNVVELGYLPSKEATTTGNEITVTLLSGR
ncbi:hypothetical protein ACSBR2_020351 [Camellia fascicularis]